MEQNLVVMLIRGRVWGEHVISSIFTAVLKFRGMLSLAWRSRESRRPCTRKITFLRSGVRTSASHRLRRGMLSGECHYIRDRQSLWFHPAKKVGSILKPPFFAIFTDGYEQCGKRRSIYSCYKCSLVKHER